MCLFTLSVLLWDSEKRLFDFYVCLVCEEIDDKADFDHDFKPLSSRHQIPKIIFATVKAPIPPTSMLISKISSVS